jgi:Tol biopolymer transport system component
VETGEFGDYLYSGSINDPVYSPDGSVIAGHTIGCTPGSCNGTVLVINAETGESVLSRDFQGFVDYVAFAPNSELIAYGLSETGRVTQGVNVGTALQPSAIHIVNVATGEDVITINEEQGILGKLFFSDDGTRIAYNSMLFDTPIGILSSGVLHIIDIETGDEIQQMAAGYLVTNLNPDWTLAAVNTLVFLPGSVSSGGDGPFIANVETSETVTSLNGFRNFNFNPDWTLLIAGVKNEDTFVPMLSNASTLESLVPLPIENLSNGFSYTFSPDSSMIAITLKLNDDDNFYLSLWGIPQP